MTSVGLEGTGDDSLKLSSNMGAVVNKRTTKRMDSNGSHGILIEGGFGL